MNATWETILDHYLCGEGSRADVESLRLRLGLGAEEREEIEATLRLADELAAAGDTIIAPGGAVERLTACLSEHVAEDDSASMPRWEWDGSAYRADPMVLRPRQPIDDENAANAIIEGTLVRPSFPRPVAGDSSDESKQQLQEFQEIVDRLSDPEIQPCVPAGAEDRLAARLEGRMQRADQVDPGVARRILRQLKSCPLPSLFNENVPDVLAATTDPDANSTLPKPPEDKP